MGLFEKIFGSKKEKNLQTDTIFQLLNGYIPSFTTWGGQIYESELVRAAIHARATHISKMAVRVLGAAEPSLQAKLRREPNAFQSWSQFLYRTSTILDVNNTAFIVPVIDEYDRTNGIFTVLPSMCEFVEKNGVPYLRYRFGNGKSAAVELEKCAILTKFQYRNDFTGETNKALDPTMALVNIQNQGIWEGVKSAASYRFMAQSSNFATEEDLLAERKHFSERNLSRDAGGGLLLFPNTYTNIKQLECKPFVVDAEQMKVIQTNVYNYFGVNEKIMQNSANADELDAFYNGALEPFAIQLAEGLTRMLFTPLQQANGSRVSVASDRLQYMSTANKLTLIQTLGDRGMLRINEARELLNYEPVDGGDVLMPIRGEYYNAQKEDDNGRDDE